MAHSAEMARLTVLLALATCVVGVARAAAVKGGAKSELPITHPDHPARPKPLVPAAPGPCDVKRLPCVPVYSEEGAARLAELGIMEQVAVDYGPLREPPRGAPSKRKTAPCRRGGDCRRKHKTRRSAHQQKQH